MWIQSKFLINNRSRTSHYMCKCNLLTCNCFLYNSNLFSVIIRHLSVPLFHIDSVILIHTILYVNPLTFSVHSQSRYCSHDVTSNPVSAINSLTINNTIYMPFCQGDSNKSQHALIKNQQNPTVLFVKTTKTQVSFLYIRKKGSFSPAIHKHTSCNFCK